MSTPKIALMTGGSRGLGKNMAVSLTCKGADVLVTSLNKQAETEVAKIKALGRRATALLLNVAEAPAFDAFFAQVRTALRDAFQADYLHFLINNAGTGIYAPFTATLAAQLDEMYNISLKGFRSENRESYHVKQI